MKKWIVFATLINCTNFSYAKGDPESPGEVTVPRTECTECDAELFKAGLRPSRKASDKGLLAEYSHYSKDELREVQLKLVRQGQSVLRDIQDNKDFNEISDQKDPIMKKRTVDEIRSFASRGAYTKADAIQMESHLIKLAKIAVRLSDIQELIQQQESAEKEGDGRSKKKVASAGVGPSGIDSDEFLEDARGVMDTLVKNPSNWVQDRYQVAQNTAVAALQPNIPSLILPKVDLQLLEHTIRNTNMYEERIDMICPTKVFDVRKLKGQIDEIFREKRGKLNELERPMTH